MADPFAKHIVASIRSELSILKEYNYIEGHAYDEILRLLPTNIGARVVSASGYPPSSPYSNLPSMPAPTGSPMGGGAPPPPSYNNATNKSLGSAEALYDFNGTSPATDLNLRRGDIIEIIEYVNDDWWKGTVKGKTGIFPSSYAKKLDAPREKMPPPPPARRNERESYGGYSPGPPKQDAPYQYPAPPSQQNSYNQGPANTYIQPPPTKYQPPQQQVSYAAPPPSVAHSSSSAAPAEEHESKASGFGKKLAGNVASAATWGFGATLGSDLANKIF